MEALHTTENQKGTLCRFECLGKGSLLPLRLEEFMNPCASLSSINFNATALTPSFSFREHHLLWTHGFVPSASLLKVVQTLASVFLQHSTWSISSALFHTSIRFTWIKHYSHCQRKRENDNEKYSSNSTCPLAKKHVLWNECEMKKWVSCSSSGSQFFHASHGITISLGWVWVIHWKMPLYGCVCVCVWYASWEHYFTLGVFKGFFWVYSIFAWRNWL